MKELDRSPQEIKQAVLSIIGEPLETSKNGRQFRSRYEGRDGSTRINPTEVSERLYSMITILGDERPYQLHVQTFSQRRQSSGYSKPRYEAEKSKGLGLAIQMRLSQSRGEKNFIDDFRPF